MESGVFHIEIGSSSRDIRAELPVEVTGTKEIPITFTYTSTVGELMKTEKGRAFMQKMMGASADRQAKVEDENLRHMGEGSEKIAQSMMVEMPLRSIVSFGRMTWEQLDALIAMLNS